MEPASATSLARLLWPIISSLTSTVYDFGNLVRQALDFDSAGDDFEQSALHLDARRFAGGVHRNGDANALGQIDALQVGVQQVRP